MKKKILFRIGTLQAGGAERMLVDIINHMDTNLYNITLLLNVDYGVFKSQLRKDITYKYLCKDKEWTFISNHVPIFSTLIRYIKHKIYSYFPFLIEKFILEGKKYDTTVTFLQDMVNEGYKTKANNKIIWVHIVMSDYIKENRYKLSPKGYEKRYGKLKNYNKVISVSETVNKDLGELYPEVAHKLLWLLNPINKELVIEKSKAFFPIEYIPYKEKIKIVSVGRITTQKGFFRLVDLCKELNKHNILVEIFIVGMEDNKEYTQKLKEKIIQQKAPIHILGHKENPYPYIKNAEIMVHPAIHEGYGLVLAESLLLQTPVVATDIQVFREFANDEIFYISNNDEKFPIEATEAIKKIMNGEKKGNVSNTNIVDIKEYVNKLNSIF